jgi:hypothetical protein
MKKLVASVIGLTLMAGTAMAAVIDLNYQFEKVASVSGLGAQKHWYYDMQNIDGKLYAGLAQGKVLEFDPATGSQRVFDTGITGGIINRIVKAGDGNIYAAAAGTDGTSSSKKYNQGVARLDLTSGTTTKILDLSTDADNTSTVSWTLPSWAKYPGAEKAVSYKDLFIREMTVGEDGSLVLLTSLTNDANWGGGLMKIVNTSGADPRATGILQPEINSSLWGGDYSPRGFTYVGGDPAEGGSGKYMLLEDAGGNNGFSLRSITWDPESGQTNFVEDAYVTWANSGGQYAVVASRFTGMDNALNENGMILFGAGSNSSYKHRAGFVVFTNAAKDPSINDLYAAGTPIYKTLSDDIHGDPASSLGLHYWTAVKLYGDNWDTNMGFFAGIGDAYGYVGPYAGNLVKYDWIANQWYNLGKVDAANVNGIAALEYGNDGKLYILATNADGSMSIHTQAVPEPSSIAAMLTGLAGMAGFVVRRKKA